MKKTYILITLITALLCYIYCRCSFPKYSKNDKTSKTKVTEMTELTERQKKVLESEGLPTDIDKLSYQQKSGIIHIEKAFEYLDDKYPGVEFEYLSHRPEGILGSQLTKFVPAGYDKEDYRNVVTVERDKFENKYTDDYMCVVTRQSLEKVIDGYVKKYFGSRVKIFANVGKTYLEYGDEISESTVIGKTFANSMIFLPEDICKEGTLEEFANVCRKWSDENNVGGSYRVTVVSSTDFEEINYKNFRDFYVNGHIKDDISF